MKRLFVLAILAGCATNHLADWNEELVVHGMSRPMIKQVLCVHRKVSKKYGCEEYPSIAVTMQKCVKKAQLSQEEAEEIMLTCAKELGLLKRGSVINPPLAR